MAEQSQKMCGVCKRSPRGDDATHPMRLHADDLVNEGGVVAADSEGKPITPGMYQSCRDCIAFYKPKIAARLRRTPLIDDNTGRPVYEWDDKGLPVKPVMVLGPTQEMSQNHLF